MASETIETAFQTAITSGKVKGGVICATNASGSFTYNAALGERTLLSGEKRPQQLDDMLYLASATKLIASIAAMQCVEDGLLSLDGDLSKLAPELASLPVLASDDEGAQPVPAQRPVTLAMLLTHTSGLSYDFLVPRLVRWRQRNETEPAAGARRPVEEAFAYPLAFQPGTAWMYGPGLDWAGRIVERVTGVSLGDHVRRRIAAPLGIAPDDAQFYPVRGDGVRARLVDLNPEDPEGVGRAVLGGGGDMNRRSQGDFGGHGMSMTGEGYVKVLRSLLANDGKLLQPKTVEDMFQNHIGPDAVEGHRAAMQGPTGVFFRVGTDAGTKLGHGLGGLLMLEDLEGWYGEKTMSWGGGMSFAWFIDRKNDLCGLGAVQPSLPLAGETVEGLKQTFRHDIYRKYAEITALVQDLESVGFQTELRAGHDDTLLAFVKAPRKILGSYVYNSRLKDWLYGIVQTHPGGAKNAVVDGAFEAEDILSVYHLVNWPKSNGGAGITPGWGQWENIDSIFPLHDEPTNVSLLKHLSSRFFLTNSDLDQIRNLFGTKYWKIQQIDLSIRWDVKGVGTVKVNRPQFRWERIVVDSTGRKRHYVSKRKQVLRQLLQIPVMAAATLVLGIIILGVFALETLVSEGYDGPYKNIIINGHLESIATLITDFENHRTEDNYDMSRTQKFFFLQIITNYLPIFITAFLYVPFGDRLIPQLESLARKLAGSYVSKHLGHVHNHHIDGDRLRTEIIALTVSGQLSSFFEENLLPVLKRKFFEWYRNFRTTEAESSDFSSIANDDPNETEILESARRQATLEPYNVQDDIAEIALQFGTLALFSPVWPLISIGFFLNNIIELRTDFFKLTQGHQRPAPVRTDGIGPWIASLDFLAWAGSISTGAIVHLYSSKTIAGGAWWALPITIFVSEHIFLGLRAMVRFVLDRIGSEHIRKQRNAQYLSRVKHLEEIEANRKANLMVTPAERERGRSIRATSSDAFFAKQVEEGPTPALRIYTALSLGNSTTSPTQYCTVFFSSGRAANTSPSPANPALTALLTANHSSASHSPTHPSRLSSKTSSSGSSSSRKTRHEIRLDAARQPPDKAPAPPHRPRQELEQLQVKDPRQAHAVQPPQGVGVGAGVPEALLDGGVFEDGFEGSLLFLLLLVFVMVAVVELGG
ncbi:calcium-activated chloride channel-domain-containing protein [Chaetomium fimeti]|uniref:Calcium-activated chloride channel-domain-containing protein n=1 Tax=Chaetomium fimeti TaxID=1854472 RepID=A0AAE0HEU7_9PEZI|nr:calcium-activated chloride channel-domain-containing protein [Chaetomium fimeti]